MVTSIHRAFRRLAAIACAGQLYAGTAAAGPAPATPVPEPLAVGARRELFVDDALVETLAGDAELRLHHPAIQDVALATDQAWEGNGTNYITVFKDGDKYRMYYMTNYWSYMDGKDRPTTRVVECYAESPDGIHWTRPELGLVSWNGSTRNNILLDTDGIGGFTPFRDLNPQCAPDAPYKAVGVSTNGPHPAMHAWKSVDAIHWKPMSPDPIITKGAFDSQNVAFWDASRGEYRTYFRDFRGTPGMATAKTWDATRSEYRNEADLILAGPEQGRDIRTATSKDFIHWSEPEFLTYTANVHPGQLARPGVKSVIEPPRGRVSELYTNGVRPYYRAPDLLLGFPTRYVDRGWTASAKKLPRPEYRVIRAKQSDREGTAVTDGMFMTSRDREHFSVWPESFIRPGLRERDTWFYGDIYQGWGLVETKSALEDAPAELSLYATERAAQDRPAVIRRYTLRIDGFASLHAPLAGGELVTKPLVFSGNKLSLNVSTSAAGSVRIEIQDLRGQPLPGFALADCEEIYGDDLDRLVEWKGRPELGSLAGQPVRLRIVLQDADLYSFQFRGPAG